ncbi:MAG: ABC transporter ATP-binding protein [Acidimicrobiales bacterium]
MDDLPPSSLVKNGAAPASGVTVTDLSVKYRTGREKVSSAVFEGLNFSVPAGEFVAIVGPSGCGKSTLLKAIAGLIAPSSGSVVFGDGLSPKDERIGFLFQSDALLPWCTAAKNIAIAGELGGDNKESSMQRARDLMDRVGLSESKDKYPGQLSGGMRRRVSLARALVYRPSVFLMDEPFSALDAQTRVVVGNFFLEILEEASQTVLFVTHDIEEAVALADRVVVLSLSPGGIVGDYRIDIPRPRDYYESRFSLQFIEYQQLLAEKLGLRRGAGAS